MRDSQAKELALMYEESLTVRSDQEYTISVLRLENQRLKDEISAYKVVCAPRRISALAPCAAAPPLSPRDAALRRPGSWRPSGQDLIPRPAPRARSSRSRTRPCSPHSAPSTTRSAGSRGARARARARRNAPSFCLRFLCACMCARACARTHAPTPGPGPPLRRGASRVRVREREREGGRLGYDGAATGLAPSSARRGAARRAGGGAGDTARGRDDQPQGAR